MLARNYDLFRIFLANGGAQYLDETQWKVACMIANESPYKEIATKLLLTRREIDQNINRIKRIAFREAAKQANAAERESLIANLKATKRPLMKIPIDGLFLQRLEDALKKAFMPTLGDIVVKGRIILSRSQGVENGDVAEVERTLLLFDANLPE